MDTSTTPPPSATYCIYYLRDPRDNTIRYVGQTMNMKRRFNSHLSNKGPTHVGFWVRGLRRKGLKPVLEVVVSGLSKSEANTIEIEKIAELTQSGCKLCNKTAGGDQTHVFGEKSRAKLSLNNGNVKTYQFLNPEGEVVSIHNLRRFCLEQGLSYNCMRHVFKNFGRHVAHKGWKRVPESALTSQVSGLSSGA